MSGLIDDLLLLALLASTRLGTTTRVDVRSLISTHFADLRALDPGRNIDLSCEPCFVEGDQALLERMFVNLASKIQRYSSKTAKVVVTCTARDVVVHHRRRGPRA